MNKPLILTFLVFTNLISFSLYAQYVEINLVNSKINDNEQKKIEKLIAYERMFCNEIFETSNNITVPVKINLYGKSKDYRIEKNKYNAPSSTGFYISAINQAFIMKSGDFIPVALHEASHSIFQFNYQKAPKWLNEGLAEFFETLDFDSDGNLYAYPQSNRIKSIKAGLAFKDTDRLKTFFRIYDGTFYGHGIDDNYNTAYSMIYYFVKNKSTKALKNIIKLTAQGYDTEKAITLTYGSFDTFEASYKQFYNLHH
ncbi:DUF1570 domain-containing protein [Pedobacter riviphilus]|uniref:DUF1570 domain-containing protein n=1 Tax=Pedobacter riviphilus TaxID=2766984 RepID=A0ABX6TIR9_9SPHI|nr:DUF1570 domain-containing protein [Pedobacter riviphilus]QNR85413.1 DUF1570 domain-containing protein [Pedobacter riviphilus]